MYRVQIVLLVFGVLLLYAPFADVFRTLFHPSGRGAISDFLARVLWRMMRSVGKRNEYLLNMAGPIIFLAIVASWALLIVLAFSLIYMAMIGTFVASQGINAAEHRTYYDAFNTSMGALISLGSGINPSSKWVRLVMDIEAVVGFGLLTASVSSLLSIYSVLKQRDAVAQKTSLLHYVHVTTGKSILDMAPGSANAMLADFVAEMVSLRSSLSQFPVTYYFRAEQKMAAMPGAAFYLRGLAAEGSRSPHPDIQVPATMLGGAIEDFLKLLATDHLNLPCDDLNRVLREYARDQLREPMPYPSTQSRSVE